ncbi:MAG TPA: c-type cytochrome [Methylomirabilota bacterium]|jgi:mono/diheme cytochrome c family protein|nr:c-type cytochrome [Methylomirabilota bacterium]
MPRLVSALAIVLALGGGALAQTPRPPASPKPITMEELHRLGGVPRGWKFTLPAGDAKIGREIFAKLECNKCHEIKPDFPRSGGTGDVGPELTGMGAHHPAEYFAQSIIDPNAVILAGPGYVGPDGRSIMPDYRDSLTVAELADLVAYIKSLGGGAHDHHHHHDANAPREQTAGPYRVRVEYREPGAGHAHGAKTAKATGHLMVFVIDTATGEAVPYLPVSAAIRSVETPPRTLRLAPMLGGAGFHYGADVTLPDDTVKVTLTLGAAALKAMGPAPGRFGKPVTVSFDWE